MDTTLDEEKGAYRWFFIVGVISVCFSVFLATVDRKLSTSTAEQELGETLHELRSAQAGLPSRVTDRRQLLGDGEAPN